MDLIFWLIIFVISIFALIKGSDILIDKSEKIGLAIGLSPFIVGVTIVAIGTSLPEVVSSIFAIIKGVYDLPVANAIGSNIFNILVIVGLSAIAAKRLVVSKNLIDLDSPLLAISTAIVFFTLWDKKVSQVESLIMFSTYLVYVIYTIIHKDEKELIEEKTSFEIEKLEREKNFSKPKLNWKDIFFLFLGIGLLTLGAEYLIQSIKKLSQILNIATGVITITAVAAGTSLPEVFVSVKAARQKKSEIALGNIFGSNVFNGFMVIGLPGIISSLTVDTQTFNIGIPMLIISTFLFILSGISKRIYIWEGIFYIALYILFIGKIFNIY
ncbi:MAG: calcium/sodium antiporter [Patescibacteria group bacterium]|nr:calcium/sodium antiporter [Patescibacteria group bacterium]